MESPTRKSRSNPKGSQDLNERSKSRRVRDKNENGSASLLTSSSNKPNSSNPNQKRNLDSIKKSSNLSITRFVSLHNDHSSY